MNFKITRFLYYGHRIHFRYNSKEYVIVNRCNSLDERETYVVLYEKNGRMYKEIDKVIHRGYFDYNKPKESTPYSHIKKDVINEINFLFDMIKES